MVVAKRTQQKVKRSYIGRKGMLRNSRADINKDQRSGIPTVRNSGRTRVTKKRDGVRWKNDKRSDGMQSAEAGKADLK